MDSITATEQQPEASRAPVEAPKGWYGRLKKRVADLSGSPHAVLAMAVVAIVDGSVFPVPPFAILVPMCIARPKQAFKYCTVGTVASIFGGLIGYAIGMAARAGMMSALGFDPNMRIDRFGIHTTVGEALGSNFWILALLSSVLPTPYKVVAIGSGLVDVPLYQFVLASIIGRSARFYGIGLFTAFAGERYTRWREARQRPA